VKTRYSLVIVGAGPAGLSASVVAANLGVDVALLDEQRMPGGQIYRAMESVPAERAMRLGEEYQRGRGLVSAMRESRVDYFPDSEVWSLNQRREIGLVHAGVARVIGADQVLIANGAMERPLPFPGWTLPGVMNAGAGQILFKAHGLVPADGVVLAGSGPLLLLLAWQYLHAGVAIEAILDLTPMHNHLRALPHLPRALLARHYLGKGLAYKKDLKRAGVQTLRNITDLHAAGDGRLETITFRHKGRRRTLATQLLLTHFGVAPRIHLSQAAGCRHCWDDSQQCWRPLLDGWGNSSIDGILIAGDGAGIGGARAAEHAGRLAAWQMACALGRIDSDERDRLARDDRGWLRAERHVRPFLDAFFRIPGSLLVTSRDDTIVCRCEEITAGEIRAAVAQGHDDANQVKFLTRCGMGACQGRQCAASVAHIVAAQGGKHPANGGPFRGRPPVAPLTLGQLASLYPEESE